MSTMMSENTVFYGWDIGGAHLKVACADADGHLQHVLQFPCALWRGLAELEQAFTAALAQMPLPTHSIHAVTMTGELVDAFANREQGVNAILQCVATVLPISNTHIFAAGGNWFTIQQALFSWQEVASMNWQASAQFAATQVNNGIFIDIGSTTCDIIAFQHNTIRPQGMTDYDRHRHYELVYTGAIRTPLMVLAQQAPLHGSLIPLAAEWFASSADIWLMLDKLTAEQIQDRSADGQPWDKFHSAQRLARMLATDADTASASDWQHVARWFAEKQLQLIADACLTVFSTQPTLALDSPIVGAGVGKFIAELCAHRLERPYIDFSSLCFTSQSASYHAPAAALALLAHQQLA